MRWSSLIFTQYILLAIFTEIRCILWESEASDETYCVTKKDDHCPDADIKFFLYTSEYRIRRRIDIRYEHSLSRYGWDPRKRNVLLIHGFNGTESKSPMTIIRDAYLNRGDYNVFTIDWEVLTFFPCYLSSLSNTKIVAQCSAQFYSHLTYNGASAYDIQCVGHSLGAHICGMMSMHLSHKMHKIIGLDPARPLVDRYGSDKFRLTSDDAHIVQVIHTNAGLLGEMAPVGHIDFCVNGGVMQPSCQNEPRYIRKSRCSHFMSACFFAATISEKGRKHRGLPCTSSCRMLPGFAGMKGVSMGEHTPDDARGVFCLRMSDNKKCPFD